MFLDVNRWILMKLIWDIKLCSQIMHGLDKTDKRAQRLDRRLTIKVREICMSITGGHYIIVHQLV